MGASDIKAGGAFVELSLRDAEARRGLDNFERAANRFSNNIGGMGNLAGKLGAFVGIMGAFRMASAGTELSLANNASELALMKGEALGIYQAQLQQIDAWGNIYAQIPLIGEAIKKVHEITADRKATEQAIKNIQEVQAAVKTAEMETRKLHRETALQNAKTEGKPPSEIKRLESGMDTADRQKKLVELRDKVNIARGDEGTQQSKVTALDAPLKAAREQMDYVKAHAKDLTFGQIITARKVLEREEAASVANRPERDKLQALTEERVKAEKAYADFAAEVAAKTASDKAAALAAESKEVQDAAKEREKTEREITAFIGREAQERAQERLKVQEQADADLAESRGLLEKGNINLHNRPVVRNEDGSISTVRSASFYDKGQHVLVPTVDDTGKVLSLREAWEKYLLTEKHLGKFATSDDATAYAIKLHQYQAQEYADGSQKMLDADARSREQRIAAEKEAYEKLKVLAEKYGLDTTGLYQAMTDRILAIQDEPRVKAAKERADVEGQNRRATTDARERVIERGKQSGYEVMIQQNLQVALAYFRQEMQAAMKDGEERTRRLAQMTEDAFKDGILTDDEKRLLESFRDETKKSFDKADAFAGLADKAQAGVDKAAKDVTYTTTFSAQALFGYGGAALSEADKAAIKSERHLQAIERNTQGSKWE